MTAGEGIEREAVPRRADAEIVRRLRALFSGVPCVSLIVVLVAFMLLRWLLTKVAFLPEHSYFKPVIFVELLLELPRLMWRLGPLIVVGAMLAWRWRNAVEGWRGWKHGSVARVLVGVVAIVLAWPYATYDYNPYFDRWHALDRIAVVALCVGVWWRPVFVWPFLAVVVAVMVQFDQVIGQFPWAAPDQPLHILILFCAVHLFRTVTKRDVTILFLYLACCMVALHYWPSALAKVRSGWLWHDHVEFLLPSTYANGWWAGVSGETIGKVTSVLGSTNIVLKVFTLLAEGGILLILWKRKVSMLLLAMCMALHTGIFLVSGICFWQWVVVEACLLILIWRTKPFEGDALFSRGGLIVSVVIIVTSKWWLGPVGLMWFDSRATYSYRLEATGVSGQRYLLPPRFMAPYDQQFTFGRFSSLSQEPMLGITWGATNKKTAARLLEATTAEEILEIEAELARPETYYRAETAEKLTEFLQGFLRNIHERGNERRRLRWIAAPRGLWTLKEAGEYQYEEPLVSVRVDQVFTFFDGTTVQTIRSRPVLTVEIPSSETRKDGKDP